MTTLNSCWALGLYQPFDELTRASFRQATTESGVKLSREDEGRIMASYNGLGTFPEVDKALDILSKSSTLDPYIFSNGTESMITSSLTTSPSLSKASATLPSTKVVSVDPLKVFKPDKRTYHHFARSVGLEDHLGNIWLVSSNPFDVVGASAAGLKSAWVDRGGLGWIDGLGDATGLKPTLVVGGVDEAVQEILKSTGRGID